MMTTALPRTVQDPLVLVVNQSTLPLDPTNKTDSSASTLFLCNHAVNNQQGSSGRMCGHAFFFQLITSSRTTKADDCFGRPRVVIVILQLQRGTLEMRQGLSLSAGQSFQQGAFIGRIGSRFNGKASRDIVSCGRSTRDARQSRIIFDARRHACDC
jgi:hypothetical protein